MLQGYKLFTVTHRTADINQIADFLIDAPDDEVLEHKLKKIKVYFGIEELMYLNTCNRILFFMYKPEAIDINAFFFAVNDKLRHMTGSLNQSIEYYEDELAIHHLYEVASSVDSLVVGEREILRQLREAYHKCKSKFEITGDKLRIAMQMTVKSAKMVYGNTRIGEKPVSVVSLAVKKLLQASPKHDSRVIVIGAGQTNILMSNFLKKYEFIKKVSVFNRTLDNAQSLADRLHGKGYTLDALSTFKGGFDIMIICTGSTEKFVDQALFTQMLQGESDQKIIVDLSVPSNIHPEVLADNDINFIEIESLKKLAADNLAFRKNEIAKVKEILAERVTEFKEIYRQREIERDISHIPVEIKAVKEKALNVVFKKQLDKVDPETRDLIEEMMTYMEKKCIAVPIKKAKQINPIPTK